MPHAFNFVSEHFYDTKKQGITVPVELSNGPNIVQVDAKLDSGASFCIFERTYAEMLEVDVEQGIPELVSTPTGTFQVFGHWMTITALGFRFDSMIRFAAEDRIRRNVIGRRGWIDQVRLCLIEHDGALYLSKYDDE